MKKQLCYILAATAFLLGASSTLATPRPEPAHKEERMQPSQITPTIIANRAKLSPDEIAAYQSKSAAFAPKADELKAAGGDDALVVVLAVVGLLAILGAVYASNNAEELANP